MDQRIAFALEGEAAELWKKMKKETGLDDMHLFGALLFSGARITSAFKNIPHEDVRIFLREEGYIDLGVRKVFDSATLAKFSRKSGIRPI